MAASRHGPLSPPTHSPGSGGGERLRYLLGWVVEWQPPPKRCVHDLTPRTRARDCVWGKALGRRCPWIIPVGPKSHGQCDDRRKPAARGKARRRPGSLLGRGRGGSSPTRGVLCGSLGAAGQVPAVWGQLFQGHCQLPGLSPPAGRFQGCRPGGAAGQRSEFRRTSVPVGVPPCVWPLRATSAGPRRSDHAVVRDSDVLWFGGRGSLRTGPGCARGFDTMTVVRRGRTGKP